MATTKRAPAGAAVLRGDITVAIRNAVMNELAEVGYGRLSIEAVARRAGVGKTAIYRRWSNKLEMVMEIVSDVAERKVPLPDTGSFAGDLELLMMIVSRALQHRIASQIIPDLMAEAARNPQIAETLQRALRTHQQALAEKLVGQAVARGELPEGTDAGLAVDMMLGPLYWRLAIAREPVADDYLEKLALAVTGALRAAHP
ncbi:putative TetR-family transcriptional regulator [Actinoplanes missouriensis 431]|uniref:Putative TetR-family transcriptional regulator n=1 Tax=Actinoplanes missouriensis (strain ATCC 14538 / DSM 43046 / CBS 188.64 / JCM 3121 / NBRC 102363 / NCIMB 12654 / NRRL B-3342 / UNCC 431) TaxID=512565 RepID=I0GXY9_ACTM4|nr:putative TetR-family transcriptional regulator [Actinoplanes missouriensis 431]